VDRLEAVEIEKENDRLGSLGRRALQCLLDARVKEAAVRQPGERVVQRLVAQIRLQVGELCERLLELLVLEQQSRVAGEGAEKLLVVVAEGGDLVGAV